MADRGRYWPGRRVLVLGCTGFLGGWAVRGLLARGAEVVGLVRDPKRNSDFFRAKLFRHVHVVRGSADDDTRLRTLLAVCEAQLVLQCAAAPDGSSAAINPAVVAAAGSAPVVIPIPPRVTVRQRPANDPSGDITLVRLPLLFGGGDLRWDRWPPRLLLSAARGESPPPPPAELAGAPVAFVRSAVEELLDTIADPARAAGRFGVRTECVTPQGTVSDLLAAASRYAPPGPRLHSATDSRADSTSPSESLVTAVAEAVDWYRTMLHQDDRPTIPVPRAAA